MKIQSLEIKDFPPIKNLKFENLGDIVIIAGANGSGKTRLKGALVQTLQGDSQLTLTVLATREEETTAFRGTSITTQQGQVNQSLQQYIQNRRFGGRARYVGSLVQIDSDRNIKTVNYPQVNWLGSDPDDSDTPYNWGYGNFTSRWQDFMTYIYQKYAVRDKKLADELKKNPSEGERIIQENPDPLDKYKEIFVQLLPGKELQDIKPESPREFQYKDTTGNILPFSSLSSGEQEVVKVIFDVARKDIKHSVIIVDEPELHLHPTLAFKLIETLKTIGDHTNQFIFLTHSADLISTYYSTGDVYFIDSVQTGSNQAHKLSELNHSHKELVQLIGENLGLFAVGKKLVFVEGEGSSLDRLTYHAIAQKYLPEAKIVPIGSVEKLIALNAFEQEIRNSIFGIDLYLIRDRDGLSDEQISTVETSGKIKCLKKRHLENYFLDSEILFKVAERFCITAKKTDLTQTFIETKIKEIATESLKLNLLQNTKEYLALNHGFEISTIRAVETKDLDTIKLEMISSTLSSISKLSTDLSEENLKQWMDSEQARLEAALSSDNWKNEFQGKEIFSIFCGRIFEEDKIKVRKAYVEIALEEKPAIFDDMKVIFESFK
ncbi:MAG: AAA family ATPase [Candidatus Gracilibacteria bacterium]|jgi:predicted ATP-dependent endonuclease of OLD family